MLTEEEAGNQRRPPSKNETGDLREFRNEVRHHVGSLAKASWFSFYSICYSFPDNAPWESPAGDELKSSDSSLWL
jgi:hypothetical protein